MPPFRNRSPWVAALLTALLLPGAADAIPPPSARPALPAASWLDTAPADWLPVDAIAFADGSGWSARRGCSSHWSVRAATRPSARTVARTTAGEPCPTRSMNAPATEAAASTERPAAASADTPDTGRAPTRAPAALAGVHCRRHPCPSPGPDQ